MKEQEAEDLSKKLAVYKAAKEEMYKFRSILNTVENMDKESNEIACIVVGISPISVKFRSFTDVTIMNRERSNYDSNICKVTTTDQAEFVAAFHKFLIEYLQGKVAQAEKRMEEV